MSLARVAAGAALAVACAGAVVVPVPAGAAESPPPRAADAGHVETVVGPGVCPAGGTVDPATNTLGSLVVDGDGTIFVDAGPPLLGHVSRVDVSGATSTIRTAGPGGSPDRLASDGAGGLLVASKAHIDHRDTRGGTVPLAGDRLATQATLSSGDGGPATSARFARIVSLATDGGGNVYVADGNPTGPEGVRIRFVNRGDSPVKLYPGTAGEILVAPGGIATLAGGGQGPAGDEEPAPAVGALLRGEPFAMAASAGRLYVASYDTATQPATSTVRLVNLGGAELEAHGVKVPPGAIQTVAGGGPAGFGGDDGPARRAAVGRLPGIAADSGGNLYVADAEHHRVRRIDAAGVITTFAGAGTTARGGFNGNDQPAINARFDEPFDVAVGPDGHVYITDRGNVQVRVVNEEGVINAAQGNGLQRAWICEERGKPLPPGSSRPLQAGPVDVAVDGRGDVYFPVASNSGRNPVGLVYRLESSGRVAPFLGGSKDLESCPECRARPIALPGEDRLGRPVAVAATRQGGVYVLDAADGRLWLANPGPRPLRAHGRTVAAGAAVLAAIDTMEKDARAGSLATDERGNVYIADLHQVRRLDDEGTLTTLVEQVKVPVQDQQAARSRCCAAPAGLAVDTAGNLYVGDVQSRRVWYLNLSGTPVTVHGQTVPAGERAPVAGSGERGFEGDGGPALDAKFQELGRLAVDPGGNLYIIDSGEDTIRSVDRNGTISTVVGRGSGGFNGDGLRAGVTSLNGPAAAAVDGCGNLFIADTLNQRLRRWNTARRCVPTPTSTPASAGGRSSTLTLLMGAGALLVGLTAFGLVRRRRHRRQDDERPAQEEPASAQEGFFSETSA